MSRFEYMTFEYDWPTRIYDEEIRGELTLLKFLSYRLTITQRLLLIWHSTIARTGTSVVSYTRQQIFLNLNE